MKKLLMMVFIVQSIFFLTACTGPGESKAEYDGGYLWTSGDKYVGLKEVSPSSTQIIQAGMSIMAVMGSPKYYYVLDATPGAVLSSNDIQGIYVKGNYPFNNFSCHKLEEKKLASGEGLFENHGSATKDKSFYYAGTKVAVAKKKAEDSNGYFFKFKENLQAGKYVGWINNSFWIFEVQ